ncbi:hypothetical protein M5D96_004176 [Drosophila gunungcola]|uniref:Uncharacterized protein n=1 Tax=Drosophila gunungcola TaxID=103775 RepID=A0A9P9YU06_9MUSC|nr:hypothetical protein M5D96_004176 [Drosophila gunungcola]
MPAPPATVKPASGHTTKLSHGKSSNSNNTLCNSNAHLSDSRTNLTVNTPTTCQRLSEMFRRSIASSTQSSSRENTYEETTAYCVSVSMHGYVSISARCVIRDIFAQEQTIDL